MIRTTFKNRFLLLLKMAEKNKEKTKEKLEKNDFVNLEYIGKTKEGKIFDTNIKQEAKKINMNIETRPLAICIGQGMILQGIDEFLKGKETGKEYTLELKPEKAFGKRKKELVKTMPISVFEKQDVAPRRGMMFNFDNSIGRISAVSGGRVIVDFNNPLANKDVIYDLKVKEKIKDKKEKAKILIKTFFRKEFDFEIKDKKLIIKMPKPFSQLANMYKRKFKEILGLDLEVKEVKKEEKKQGNKK